MLDRDDTKIKITINDNSPRKPSDHRKEEILNRISRSPCGMKELKSSLEIGARSVERYVADLVYEGKIRGNGSKFELTAPRSIKVDFVDSRTAIALELLAEYMHALLPASIYDALTPLFNKAHNELMQDFSPGKKWMKKVRVVPHSLIMNIPKIDQKVLAEVQDALFEEKRISFDYCAVSSGKVKKRYENLHPRGLFSRNGMVYLIALDESKVGPTFFALNRISKAKKSIADVTHDKNFDIDATIKSFMNRGNEPKIILLKIEIREGWLVRYLEERKLGKDQEITIINDITTLTVTTEHNIDLEKWILSEAGAIKVMEPAELRENIILAVK